MPSFERYVMTSEEEKTLDESFHEARKEDEASALKITQRFIGYQTRIHELIKEVKTFKEREAIFLEALRDSHESCNKTHCKICVAMQEASKKED